jgi:hypothetical protein
MDLMSASQVLFEKSISDELLKKVTVFAPLWFITVTTKSSFWFAF